MTPPRKFTPTLWLKSVLPGRPRPPAEVQRAEQLIAAIDAGGLPLNPARVNDIARQLGLVVSPRARVEDTIERIRAAVERRPAP